jgi:hypothetical protein
MNHGKSITVLLASAPGSMAPSPGPRERQEAEEHVATCSDCWAVLGLLHELSAGEQPAEAEHMVGLYGCGSVQGEMYRLAGMPAAQIGRAFPQLARHLGWCHACRERLVEVLEVERAAARGELGPPLFESAPARWRETIGSAGESIRELVGLLVVQLERATAVFTALPEGLVVSQAMAPAAALRGAPAVDAGTGALTFGRQVQVALADSGLRAELTLEPQGAELVGIALRVEGNPQAELSVHLREIHLDRAELVARQTVRGPEPIVVKGLRPARYVLEILERQQALRFKLRFDVEPAV